MEGLTKLEPVTTEYWPSRPALLYKRGDRINYRGYEGVVLEILEKSDRRSHGVLLVEWLSTPS